MKLPYIERIWTVDGSLELDPPLLPAEAFERLDPLLDVQGTTYHIDGDTLTYSKDNPAAQDKMATFTKGTMRVESGLGQGGLSSPRLTYTLKSPALLMCFLAPLLFLAIAQFMILVNELESPVADAVEEMEEEAEEEEEVVRELHPLDVFLGAPAPEQPGEEEESEEGRDGEGAGEEEEDKGHSPTPAYVLAAIFAALYVVGRILEPWLMKRRFHNALYGPAEAEEGAAAEPTLEAPATENLAAANPEPSKAPGSS